SCSKRLSTPLVPSPQPLEALLEPTGPMAKAAVLEQSEAFSLIPFCEFTRRHMNLRGPWRINAAKVQSFLKQTKPIAEIRQRVNSTGRAQPIKNPGISLAFHLL